MNIKIILGDCRKSLRMLEDESVNTCVTSPPYFGLRDYGHEGQIGLEQTPDEFVSELVSVFREVRRVLRNDGTMWVNLGDSYYNYRPGKGQRQSRQSIASQKASVVEECPKRGNKLEGLKEKDLIGIPWRVAFALQADGWYLRQDIVWSKPNPMPESVRDRCTKSHEYIFLLSKSQNYYFDNQAIKEPMSEVSKARMVRGVSDTHKNVNGAPGQSPHTINKPRENGEATDIPDTRNKRSVWDVATKPFSEAHFATYPPELIEPCILAGCPDGGTVLDPFFGAGTTGLVSDRLGRNCVGLELNPEYADIAYRRLKQDGGILTSISMEESK